MSNPCKHCDDICIRIVTYEGKTIKDICPHLQDSKIKEQLE